MLYTPLSAVYDFRTRSKGMLWDGIHDAVAEVQQTTGIPNRQYYNIYC